MKREHCRPHEAKPTIDQFIAADSMLIALRRGRDHTLGVARSPRTQQPVGPWLCTRYCAPNKNVTKIAAILQPPARARLGILLSKAGVRPGGVQESR